ncbi:MAG: M48 family metalloprotease [Holosporaceae bacterium]|nr:MAG: M48 family metalloprotease [Holosporaceae bacterium]
MKFIAFVLSLLIFGLAQSNTMLKEGTVIRDAEIESILRSYIDPIFQQAKLNTKDLNLVLVVNSENNAAATLNTTMILNTGFLLSTSNLNEIVGVIAHEVGHLEGRHVVRSIGAMENAQRVGLLGAAAGIALGVLTQRLDLGAALAIGSSISSIYGYLKYSRAEEAAADQAAVRYLNGLCWPADGLVFFQKLLGQELLSTNLQDPYIRSHPLTRDRMHAIERQIQNSCQKPFPAQMVSRYHLMRIKLEAFFTATGRCHKKNIILKKR